MNNTKQKISIPPRHEPKKTELEQPKDQTQGYHIDDIRLNLVNMVNGLTIIGESK